MPYPNDEPEPYHSMIPCPNCGCPIILPPVDLEDRFICSNCQHVVLVKIADEGHNSPDPRHIC